MIMVLMAATSQALTKTEFEQEQKKEYLAYLLKECEYHYNIAKTLSARNSYSQERVDWYYEKAKMFKNKYEIGKKKNYSIDLKKCSQCFYGGGYRFDAIIYSDGRVDIILGYNPEVKEKAIAAEIKEQVEELTGYSNYVKEQKTELDEIGGFIKTTKVEQEVSQIQNRAKQQIKEQTNEVRYFNMVGQEVYNPDDYPYDLIVVTTYTDGRMRTTRVIK